MHPVMLIIIYSKTFSAYLVNSSLVRQSQTLNICIYIYKYNIDIVLEQYTPTNYGGAVRGYNTISILNYNEGSIQIILIKLSSNRNY